MRCDFIKNKSMIRALAIYFSTGGNGTTFLPGTNFEEKLAKAFNNPEDAKQEISNYIGDPIKPKTDDTQPEPVINVTTTGAYVRDESSNNLATYYVGGAAFAQMQTKFKRAILGKTIFDIDFKTGKYEFIDGSKPSESGNGLTVFQENIINYKNELINTLARVDDKIKPNQLNSDLSNEEYTAIINNAISEFENFLSYSDQSLLEKNGAYDAYVILKNFDKLISLHAPYIKIDKSYSVSKMDGPLKYLFDAKVSHYSGFTADDSADISKQISGLAETLLDVIPEVEPNGKVLTTSFIGKSGFNGAMQTLKEALLYTENLGNKIVDGKTLSSRFRESYNSGANALLNSDYGLVQMIDAFIANNSTSTSDRSISSFDSYRQKYLHNKLNGIKTFLLSKNTPEHIKNMFVQMFLKTEATSYRVYSFDRDSEMFTGKNLVSKMTLNQKYAFQSVIQGGLELIVNSSRVYATKLAKKYNISFSGNETVSILNAETNQELRISYSKTNGNIDISQKCFVNEDQSVLEEFMKDVYNYIIPDTYATCISSDSNYDWKADFAPFVVLASKLINQKLGIDYGEGVFNLVTTSHEINLNNFNRNILSVAERLGVIFGNSVRNTVKSLSGNNLPLFQLTSLEYNWKSCLDDVRNNADPYSMQLHNLFYFNEDLVTPPQIRNEVEKDNTVKPATKLGVNELNKLGIVDDFFFEYLNNLSNKDPDSAIYLQNATFSDKSKQFLPGFKLNYLLRGNIVESVFGKNITLSNIITEGFKDNGAKIRELTYKIRQQKYNTAAVKLINDYKAVFGELSGVNYDGVDNLEPKAIFDALTKLDNWLLTNNKSIQYYRDKFYEAGVNFKEEFHAYAPKAKEFGLSRINETLMHHVRVTQDLNSWNEYEIKMAKRFGSDIQSLALHGMDKVTNGQIEKIINWAKSNKIPIDDYYNEITKEFVFYKDEKLNSIASVYFSLEQLLTNEFNSLTIGETWAHPNKNKESDPNNPEIYETYSMANRLANQIKRSVIFGSTIHPFAQGIYDNTGRKNGVTEMIDIAIIDDEKGKIYTPNGVSDKIDSQDGSGHCTALQSVLENNSLVDAYVGANKKTIVHDVDPETGVPVLLKWAVYSLTNDVRRMGYNSVSSVEKLVQKMYGKTFNVNLELDKDFDEYKRNGGQLYVKDIIKGGDPKLVTKIIKNNNGSFMRQYEDGTFSDPIVCDTLYKIDQLFGGAWTYSKTPDGFVGNEESVNLLAAAAIKYDLRDKQIAYAVNASACKVGATNMNSANVLHDDSELRSFKIHSKYAGVMMDADHELDMAEVTEMSQMISALIEDGHYTQFVTDIYKNIGDVALKNDKIKKIIDVVDSDDPNKRSKLMEIIGRSLMVSFGSGSKDTIGLAQAFVKKTTNELNAAKRRGENYEFNIPISDPTIYGAFVSSIVSDMNKAGIKRKYEGFAGVLNPSHNMVQYYMTDGKAMLFDQFNDECRNQLTTPEYNVSAKEVANYGSWVNYVANNLFIHGKINPFYKEIRQRDIDFEDTIILYDKVNNVYYDEFGRASEVPTQIYIDNFFIYDRLKHLANLTGIDVYKNEARPRNLRGTDTLFNVSSENGISLGTFSIYDLDSVRAAQYINYLGKDNLQINVSDSPEVQAMKALIAKVGKYADVYGKKPVEACNEITQDILETFDEKGEIAHQDCFGDVLERTFVTGYHVRPAEIIAGRYQMNKLGLGPNDNIYDVKDWTYFKDKLKNKYAFPTLYCSQDEGRAAFDKVLYHNNIPVLIKFGENSYENKKLKQLTCQSINTVGNDIRNEDEVIINTKEPDHYKFSTLSDGRNNYLLINVDSQEAFDALFESDYFDNVYKNNVSLYREEELFNEFARNGKIHNGELSKKAFDKLSNDQKLTILKLEDNLRVLNQIEKTAKDQYESFLQGIKLIGARIPTQAMQSFMPFQVIAFSGSLENAVYVPKHNTAIEGSDYMRSVISIL